MSLCHVWARGRACTRPADPSVKERGRGGGQVLTSRRPGTGPGAAAAAGHWSGQVPSPLGTSASPLTHAGRLEGSSGGPVQQISARQDCASRRADLRTPCRQLSSVPGLYPRDASSTPPPAVTAADVSKQPSRPHQMPMTLTCGSLGPWVCMRTLHAQAPFWRGH